MDELDPELYTVAWIAPLEIDARVALHALDRKHEGRFPMDQGCDYVFQAGEAAGHNVIIATLPAGQLQTTASLSALASQTKMFFPNLWFGLLVGTAAGLPDLLCSSPRDIRLGDVLVALHSEECAGVVNFNLGRMLGQGQFELMRAGFAMARTETVVRSAIGSIKFENPDEQNLFAPYYSAIRGKDRGSGTFDDPGQERDILYQVNEAGVECPVQRAERPIRGRTRVWYGAIGSGDQTVLNVKKRDELRDKYGFLGLESGAAGVMNRIPVGVIRGVRSYADDRDYGEWQPYAAAMAAAYARAILAEIAPRKPRVTRVLNAPATRATEYHVVQDAENATLCAFEDPQSSPLYKPT